MPFTPGRPVTEAKADLFKAMAHPARVRVLEVLADRDATIGELSAETGLELSHLSRQVAVLRRAGLISSTRVKNTVLCTLGDPEIARLLRVARELLGNHARNNQALADALTATDDAISNLPLGDPAPPALRYS